MDLFAFIHHSDPTKLRIEERHPAKREVKLLKMTEGRTVSLDFLVTAASGDSGDSIDKLFDEGNDAGQEHSIKKDDDPKKLREDYHVGASGTGGKSFATICDGPIDFVSSPNFQTCAPFLRYVVSSDDSYHSSLYSEFKSFARSPAKDAAVTTVVVTTTVTADASIVPPPRVRVMSKNLDIVTDSTSTGGVNVDVVGTSKLNEPVDSSDSFYASHNLDSDTLHRIYVPKWNVTNKSILDDLRILNSMLGPHGCELRDLKEKNFALEGERDVMSEKIATLDFANDEKEVELASLSFQVSKLTFDLSGFQLSCDELDSKVAFLESKRDCLVTQKNSLESAFQLFRKCMEALQDEHVKILGDRVAKDLSMIEAYDPFVEAKYIDVVNALSAIDFSLLSELESKKDSCIVDLMDSLCLE
nr:hypothetical protein [Tanacetum cinerariifolium]